MIGIKLTFDSHKFEREAGKFCRSQIPYAAAVALTKTAKQAQSAVKANLPKKFILRNDHVERNIRIEPAKKADWPGQRAVVGSLDEFMVDQETGGTRTKTGGKGGFAIPHGIRDSNRQIVPRSKWPGRLLKSSAKPAAKRRRRRGKVNPKAFVLTRNGHKGVYIRKDKDSRQLMLLYGLPGNRVRLKRRDFLVMTVENIAQKFIQRNFEAAMTAAIRTQR